MQARRRAQPKRSDWPWGLPASPSREAAAVRRLSAKREPNEELARASRAACWPLYHGMPFLFWLVALAGLKHPFPSRTRPLRAPAAMILRPRARESSAPPTSLSSPPRGACRAGGFSSARAECAPLRAAPLRQNFLAWRAVRGCAKKAAHSTECVTTVNLIRKWRMSHRLCIV